MYQILNEDYKHLSLINGGILWETGFIRRLYDFGQIFPLYKDEMLTDPATGEEWPSGIKMLTDYQFPEKTHKTARLVHILFYRVPGSTGVSDFGVTQKLKIKEAKLLAAVSAKIVAMIVEISQLDTSFQKDIASLKEGLVGEQKTLQAQVDEIKTRNQALEKGAKKEDVTSYVRKSELFNSLINIKLDDAFEVFKKVKKSFTGGSEQKINKLFATALKSTENLDKKLTECSKAFGQLLELVAIKGANMREVILGSLRECDPNNPQASYIPHITEMILTAFVYKACSYDQTAVAAFYATLNKLLGEKVLKNVSPDQGSQEMGMSLIANSFASMTQQEALTKVKEILLGDENTLAARVKNRFEELVYDIDQIRSFPVPVGYATTSYTFPNGSAVSFPNCMDNALRNFINSLAYEPKLNVFSTAALKERLGLPPSHTFNEALQSFFEKYAHPESASSPAAHSAWVQVVSNIPFVLYKHTTKNADFPRGRGFMQIPLESIPESLKKRLDDQIFQRLDDGDFGYEVRACLYNVVMILNHLFNLKLFETVQDCAEQVSNPNFLDTYLQKLSSSMNAKFYVHNEPNKSSGSINQGIDALDFGNILYTTFLIQNLRCEFKTMSGHGEFKLYDVDSTTERELFDILKSTNSTSDFPETLRLLLREVLSRKGFDFRGLVQAPTPVLYSNFFVMPLENTDLTVSGLEHLLNLNVVISRSTQELIDRIIKRIPDYNEKLKLQCLMYARVQDLKGVDSTKVFDLASIVLLGNNQSLRDVGFALMSKLLTVDDKNIREKVLRIASSLIQSDKYQLQRYGESLYKDLIKLNNKEVIEGIENVLFSLFLSGSDEKIRKGEELYTQLSASPQFGLSDGAKQFIIKATQENNNNTIREAGFDLLARLSEQGDKSFLKSLEDTVFKGLQDASWRMQGSARRILENYLKTIKTDSTQDLELISKAFLSDDYQFRIDALKLYSSLLNLGDDAVYVKAKEDIAKASKSSNGSTRSAGEGLLEVLITKVDPRSGLARELAVENLQSQNRVVQNSASSLMSSILNNADQSVFNSFLDKALHLLEAADWQSKNAGEALLNKLLSLAKSDSAKTIALIDNVMKSNVKNAQVLVLKYLTQAVQTGQKDLFEQSLQVASEAFAMGIKLQALDLYEALCRADYAPSFPVAIESASQSMNGDDSSKFTALKIFSHIVKNGYQQGFEKALKAAIDGLQDSFYMIRGESKNLFEIMFDQPGSLAFKAVAELLAVVDTKNDTLLRSIKDLVQFVLQDKYKEQDKQYIRPTALKIFPNLLQSDDSFKSDFGLMLITNLIALNYDNAYDTALKVATELLETTDKKVFENGIKLLNELIEKKPHEALFDIALRAASKALQPELNAQSAGLGLLKKLVNKGYDTSYPEALKAISGALNNEDYYEREKGLELLKLLVSKQYQPAVQKGFDVAAQWMSGSGDSRELGNKLFTDLYRSLQYYGDFLILGQRAAEQALKQQNLDIVKRGCLFFIKLMGADSDSVSDQVKNELCTKFLDEAKTYFSSSEQKEDAEMQKYSALATIAIMAPSGQIAQNATDFIAQNYEKNKAVFKSIIEYITEDYDFEQNSRARDTKKLKELLKNQ